MRDYEKLTNVLRTMAEKTRGLSMLTGISGDGLPVLFDDAADAIVELLAEKAKLENSGKLLVAAFDRLKKKVPHWISVEERLPEKEVNVLCACRANIFCVMKWDGIDWYENPTHVYMSSFVTHWMPLPTPPKEVE